MLKKIYYNNSIFISQVISLEERESSSMSELDDLNSSLTEALQERDTLRDQVWNIIIVGGMLFTCSLRTLSITLMMP